MARDQAEAIRLARLAAGGDVGVTNSEGTQGNSVEQGEIPPVNDANQVEDVEPQETGKNSPEDEVQEGGTNQGNTTSEIPLNQDRGTIETGVVGGDSQPQGTPQHPLKVEDISRVESVRSPTELAQGIVDGQQFMDDNLSDVMRNLAIASNLSSLLNFTTTTTQKLEGQVTMDWILPDGLNSKLENVMAKEIADFPAPGTNNGAMIVEIPNIEPYFNTKKFLVDLHMGDLFAATQGNWHRLEVGCRKTGFVTENITTLLEHAGTRLRKQLQPTDRDQTAVLWLDPTKAKAPPIPNIPPAHNYPPHAEAMSPTARKNYIKDRTQVATIYITEYSNTRLWELENKVPPENLQQCLQIVDLFGRTNAVREAIDDALERDNGFRRRTNMRYLEVPIRFPTPDTMRNYEQSTG